MTLTAVLGSAAIVCVCSVVVGQAIWRLAGFDGWSWLSAPVGLATLIAATLAAVQLPGAGLAAAVALLVLTLAALAVVLLAGVATRAVLVETAVTLSLGLAVAALPFIATGRVGLLGVTDNADLSAHLMLADAVAQGRTPVGLDPAWYSNYPTGPHALVAALDRGVGIRLDAGFTGLMMATLALSALTVLKLLRETRPVPRVLGSLVAGISYLAASYTVQASFKETLLGLFVLGWVLALAPIASALRTRQRAVVPLGLLAAGSFADYSFVSLAWLAGATVAAAAVALLRVGRIPRLRGLPRRWLLAPTAFVVLLAAGALPQLDKIRALRGAVEATAGGKTTGGNIRAELPAYEVFGVWPSSDLRNWGAGMTVLRALAALAGCVVVWAGWWWWRRGRRPELPAAALALLAIYAGARLTATPYYSAKALAIASFVVGAMAVAAVVRAAARVPTLMAAAGVAFLALAAWSSGLALRGARVMPSAHPDQLASLLPVIRGQPTLYTAQNDFIPWLLRGVPLSFPYVNIGSSQVPFGFRAEKPWQVNEAFDFDNVAPGDLDHFRYVLEPRTAYASEPPANWHAVRATRSFVLWQRSGPTAPRSVLDQAGAPGARLDCSRPPGSQIARQPGVAATRAAPIVVAPAQLRLASGRPVRISFFRFAQLHAGGDAVAHVAVPRGRFDVSLQYVSPVAVDVEVDTIRLSLPASLEGPGAFWSAGTVASAGGPLTLRVHPRAPPALAAFRTVRLGALALTPVGSRDRIVPLRQACGSYVDWYRTG